MLFFLVEAISGSTPDPPPIKIHAGESKTEKAYLTYPHFYLVKSQTKGGNNHGED